MPSPAPAAVRWWGRLFLLGLLLLGFGLLVEPLIDPDVYIHLRDGRHWVETGLRVGNDPFTYTADYKPIEKVEWLFRVTLYGLYRLGGYALINLVKALFLTAGLFLLGVLAYRRWPRLEVAALLTVWGAGAASSLVFGERPFIFSYFFLPLVLLWVDRYRRAPAASLPQTEKWMWAIPPLVAVWANLHPGFIALFPFLGAHAAEEGWTALRARDARAWRRCAVLSGVSAASLLAAAANPVGFGMYHFIFGMVGAQVFTRSVMEWLPPTLLQQPFFFSLLAATWYFALAGARRVRLADWLVLIFFSYLGLSSRRNIPLFALAAVPLLAGSLRAWQERHFPAAVVTPRLRARVLAGLAAVAWAAVAVTAVTGDAYRLGQDHKWHAIEGTAWLQEHDFQGRLFAPFAWSGYVGWVSHGRIQVFMDGRLPLFGEATYRDYCQVFYGQPAALEVLDRYQVEGLLLSPNTAPALFEMLNRSHAWTLVYWDQVSELFVRTKGANRALAETFGYHVIDPNADPYYPEGREEDALRELERARAQAPHSYLPWFFEGEILRRLNRPDAARTALEGALALAPTHSHTLVALARLDQADGRLRAAETLLKRSLRYNPDAKFQATTCALLAAVIRQESAARRAEADRWSEQAEMWVKTAPYRKPRER